MSNIGLKSESTGKNYKKSEKMWNDCSNNIGAFPKMNKTKKTYTEGATGTQLAIRLIVFSNWMLIESKPGLDGKKSLFRV